MNAFQVLTVLSLVFCFAAANTQNVYHPNSEHRPSINSRSGIGLQGGFDVAGNGLQGGFQVGNPLNNNLLFPVIVGLGLLSFVNIVLTILAPLFNKTSVERSGTVDDTATETESARGLKAMDMIHMANTVYEAIEKFNAQQ